MALVRTLMVRNDSEVAALIQSWDGTGSASVDEPEYVAPAGVPLVAAQMFGGIGHKVTETRVVAR